MGLELMPTFHCLASPLVVLVLVFNLFSAERQNGRRKQQPSTVNQQRGYNRESII